MSDSDNVRASDADRDAAIERLGFGTAEGRLTLEELTERIEAVQAAKTHGELVKVTADLPERASTTPAPRSTRRQRMVTVFGDATRSGSWRAEGELVPVSVFGDIELDLRQATVPSGEVSIKAYSPFGNIEVLVPSGVDADVNVFTLFGSKKIAVREAARSGSAPVVHVRAFSLFGSIRVWSP